MPNVVRFSVSSLRSPGLEVFVPGVGVVKNGVIDVLQSDSSAVSQVRAALAPYAPVETVVDTSAPVDPQVSLPDPYPQYLTQTDFTNDLLDGTGPLSLSLKAAFGAALPLRAKAQSLLDRMAPDGFSAFADLATDLPTVTLATAATLTGRIVAPHTGEVTEVGTRGNWNSTFNRLGVGDASGLDFRHYGTAVEIGFFPGVTGALPMQVFVDGKPTTATPASIGSVTASTDQFVKLTFGAARWRRIEVFLPHQGSWYSVRGALGDVFSPAPRRPTICWVGDSFYAGSAGSPVLQCPSFLASRHLGVECYEHATARGGTGYTVNGAFTTYGNATRLAAIAKAPGDLIVVQGSINDDANAASVQAAASAMYAALASAHPDVPVVVLGPQPSGATETVSGNRAASIAAVKAAALAADNVIGFFDMVGTASGTTPSAWSSGATYAPGDLVTHKGSIWQWSSTVSGNSSTGPDLQARWRLVTWGYYGTGRVGATAGDGPRDTQLHSDGTHPTVMGSETLTAYTVQAIRKALRDFAATGAKTVA